MDRDDDHEERHLDVWRSDSETPLGIVRSAVSALGSRRFQRGFRGQRRLGLSASP
jgi:hypothetical protein